MSELLTTILRSTLAHIKNLALLHQKQNNIYIYIYIIKKRVGAISPVID
jgi:hypothetical protein